MPPPYVFYAHDAMVKLPVEQRFLILRRRTEARFWRNHCFAVKPNLKQCRAIISHEPVIKIICPRKIFQPVSPRNFPEVRDRIPALPRRISVLPLKVHFLKVPYHSQSIVVEHNNLHRQMLPRYELQLLNVHHEASVPI